MSDNPTTTTRLSRADIERASERAAIYIDEDGFDSTHLMIYELARDALAYMTALEKALPPPISGYRFANEGDPEAWMNRYIEWYADNVRKVLL